jgi:hypothetical protein
VAFVEDGANFGEEWAIFVKSKKKFFGPFLG